MDARSALVIDDSPTILKVVQLALTKGGYRVRTAPSGELGLALARESRPDVILLDFVMPDMNGLQVCRQLLADNELAGIPVVLMSAKGDEVGELFAKMANVSDCLTKPFSPEALLTVVGHTIEKRARGGADSPEQRLASLVKAAAVESAATKPTEDALSGDMSVIPVAEILILLQSEAKTGVLTATLADARVEVTFRSGRIEFATAVGVADEFLLGRFAVEDGYLTGAELTAVLADRDQGRGQPPLLGTELVRRGLLTTAELKQAMTRQTAELVYEVLRWGAGRFAFRVMAELPPPAREAALGISAAALLMEGFRRVDEWRVIEREVDSFDLVFVRDDERLADLGRGKLTHEEDAVLDLINGRNTVRDIIRLAGMGSFDVTKMLYRLLRIKLIRRRVPPMAV